MEVVEITGGATICVWMEEGGAEVAPKERCVGDMSAWSDCTESRFERAVGDIGVVDGTEGRSWEIRLLVLMLIPAFCKARILSAMLPPEATTGPSASASASAVPLAPFKLIAVQ